MIPDSFLANMQRCGLRFSGPLIADTRLHRFKAEGDKSRNSWYVIFPGPPCAGAFGCWRRGIKETWCERQPRQMSQAEWRKVQERWKRADTEREQADAKRKATARKTAAWILTKAAPVPGHAYLDRKGVRPFGDLRQWRGALVIPLCDTAGELYSLQFIAADGTKRFLTGGRTSGCHYKLAENPKCPLVICEGFATGASIHEATGYTVACAMNCGNLLAVAESLRAKWPEREIIIAADNDQWTTGNPGLTKSTEAAKSINAKLVAPAFADTTNKPTDFNDLHLLQGLNTVKQEIESAEVAKETDEEALQRLATLAPIEFDRCVEEEAKALGCTVGTLRSEVEKRRPWAGGDDSTLQGYAVTLPDVQPWPKEVNGAEVLNQVSAVYSRYVVLPAGAADALALYTAHAHCFEAFHCSPRLNIHSPDKGCGKTTLRDVLALLVPRPLPAENLTTAVLFRVIQARKPTILADEYDSWLHDKEELRGMLNAGHRRGGQTLRCEGDSHEVRGFKVFCPVVLCGIGSLPGTLHDRSIRIMLVRAKPGEVVARFDSRRTDAETELARKLARWTTDNLPRLEACDPQLPAGAFNRLADNWRPLFAVAEVAGGDWPRWADEAFAKLTSGDDLDAHGIGTMLLADILSIFTAAKSDKLPSAKLAAGLAEIEGRPWAEFGKAGKPISANQLAKQLRRFVVTPHTIRCGDETAKGYELADFKDAFERFLPNAPVSNRHTVTMPENIGDSPDSESSQLESVLHPEIAAPSNNSAGCDGVTVQKPEHTPEQRKRNPLFQI